MVGSAGLSLLRPVTAGAIATRSAQRPLPTAAGHTGPPAGALAPAAAAAVVVEASGVAPAASSIHHRAGRRAGGRIRARWRREGAFCLLFWRAATGAQGPRPGVVHSLLSALAASGRLALLKPY